MEARQDQRTLFLEKEWEKLWIRSKRVCEPTLGEPITLEETQIPEVIQTHEKIIDLGSTNIFINYCKENWD